MDNGGGSNLEIVIDRILFSSRDLKKKLELLREGNPQNDKMEHKTEDQLRAALRLKGLERENTELRQALEDHQYGLEFIMSKYRSQVNELIKLNKIEKTPPSSNTLFLKRNNSID